MFVDVPGQARRDELLDGHRRQADQRGPTFRELIIAQPADHRGDRARALLEERDRLRFGAASVVLLVLKVPTLPATSPSINWEIGSRTLAK